ncbi:hypothetical protein [Candidatus Thiodictyon syntrophicum]|jgi:hypothetical protein|uniref:Uncharacterized protein n=1 Tax=Candidatus Thiodictyon syntrophicum TaxID=1166950 RepID=A0A2K8UBN7_9GAMM|nr:hypothetical protein [Candidatus Thiodictyon syntrophicum]AUB82994.1 hypothetical protein THSYN_19945 [Candidatus Thiodictyon syntrophicum]
MTSPLTEPPAPPAAQVTQPAPNPHDQQQWLQATCEVVVDYVPLVVRDQAQCEGIYTNLLSIMVWVLPSILLTLVLLIAGLVRHRRNQPPAAATDPSTPITDTPTSALGCLTGGITGRRPEALATWLDPPAAGVEPQSAQATTQPARGSALPPPAAPAYARAVAAWRKKLEFLLEQKALTSNPAQRFELSEQIDECRAKLLCGFVPL